MRKRPSRPARFAAVDNAAIDSLPSILAVGLLTRLIRAKDGDDVTVESLARAYDEGESALSKAMRALVHDAHVVKFKVQRAATETFTDADGTTTVKRGGSWYTTFSVDSIPFTRDDVALMIEDIVAGGNVKAMRVEPAHLDPRKEPEQPRPTPQNAGVGPTRGNTDSDPAGEDHDPRGDWPRPTPQQPGAGRPTPGQGGAHIETGFKDEGKTAHSARSAPDAGGKASGSSSLGKGGSAASGKSGPRRTKEESQAIRSVREELGRQLPDLDRAIGEATPRPLGDAILAGLALGSPAARTPGQLVAYRVLPRWTSYWAPRFYAGELSKQPIGPLVQMVTAAGRDHGRCDERVDVDTGQACRACEMRAGDRRADRQQGSQWGGSAGAATPAASLPGPRVVVHDTAGSVPECTGRDGMCGRPTAGAASGLCRRCEQEAADLDGALLAPF